VTLALVMLFWPLISLGLGALRSRGRSGALPVA
jgi:hypothetical protein